MEVRPAPAQSAPCRTVSSPSCQFVSSRVPARTVMFTAPARPPAGARGQSHQGYVPASFRTVPGRLSTTKKIIRTETSFALGPLTRESTDALGLVLTLQSPITPTTGHNAGERHGPIARRSYRRGRGQPPHLPPDGRSGALRRAAVARAHLLGRRHHRPASAHRRGAPPRHQLEQERRAP